MRPTRITHNSATLIDNVSISFNLSKTYTSGIIISDISDHLPCLILISTNNKIKRPPYKTIYRDLNNNNIIKIQNDLRNYNWTDLIQENANDAYMTAS